MRNEDDASNQEFMKQGILSCCKDIEKDANNIIKNCLRGKCTAVKITIIIEPNSIPHYIQEYEYISEDFVYKKLNGNKGEN